jgi:hypothetical protein
MMKNIFDVQGVTSARLAAGMTSRARRLPTT